MDPKASAKSKRTQSQQARRNHPTPSSTAHKKKPGGDEKPRRAHHPALPTNWDRYGEDGDEEVADGSTEATKRGDAEIAPKSKGADFAYLVEQARSQSAGVQFSSPFDEIPDEFMQGVSSLLSARGKGLLLSCEEDDFIVDDDSSSTFEVPFLSMDLHALAAQLSKLKLSQRLFIEADLLPEEAEIEESKETDPSEQSQMSIPSVGEYGSASSAFFRNLDSEKDASAHNVGASSDAFNDLEILQRAEVEQQNLQSGLSQPSHIGLMKNSEQLEDSERVKSQLSTGQNTKWSGTRFQATAAEAELDLLLGSSGDATVSSPVADGPSVDDHYAAHNPMFGSFAPSVPLSGQNDSLGQASATSFDDDLDSLIGSSHAHLQTDIMQGAIVKKGRPQTSPVPELHLTNNNSQLFKDHGRREARDFNQGSVSSFDPSPAEAELDMLLEKFGATGLSSSAGCSTSPPSAISFDQDLDDLLAETSL